MSILTNKPRSYKVSFISFIILIVLAALSLPVSIAISKLFTGWDTLGAILLSLLAFISLGHIACISSFISGIFNVQKYKHTLFWIIPQGIILLASSLTLVAYLFKDI